MTGNSRPGLAFHILILLLSVVLIDGSVLCLPFYQNGSQNRSRVKEQHGGGSRVSTFCISVEAAMKFCCKDCGKKEGHQPIPDVSGKSITLKSSGYLGVARKKQEGCFQSQQSHCVYKRKGLEAHGSPRTQTG